MNFNSLAGTDFPIIIRLGIIFALAISAHLLVVIVRKLSKSLLKHSLSRSYSKVKTINTLVTSILIFALYFFTLGFALNELGVSLTAYLASASVIGLAVGFGSQGIVQDVVTGLTILLSDLFDVGDLVEIGGQPGLVKKIGMRFVLLENSMGAEIIVPNRSITNVVRYVRGYIRCYIDIIYPNIDQDQNVVHKKLKPFTESIVEQLAGVFLEKPEFMGLQQDRSGRTFERVKFRIWPGRGDAIEKAFKSQLPRTMKDHWPEFNESSIVFNYEIEPRKELSIKR